MAPAQTLALPVVPRDRVGTFRVVCPEEEVYVFVEPVEVRVDVRPQSRPFGQPGSTGGSGVAPSVPASVGGVVSGVRRPGGPLRRRDSVCPRYTVGVTGPVSTVTPSMVEPGGVGEGGG